MEKRHEDTEKLTARVDTLCEASMVKTSKVSYGSEKPSTFVLFCFLIKLLAVGCLCAGEKFFYDFFSECRA